MHLAVILDHQDTDASKRLFLQAIQHLLQQGRTPFKMLHDQGHLAARRGDQLAQLRVGFFRGIG